MSLSGSDITLEQFYLYSSVISLNLLSKAEVLKSTILSSKSFHHNVADTFLILIMDIHTSVVVFFLQKVAGALADKSSNSERELQVHIPWQRTLALLGKNMVHSTAHLLHRYGLLSFYWMFTPRGIGSILLKFRSLLPLALLLLLLLFHHFSHLPFLYSTSKPG